MSEDLAFALFRRPENDTLYPEKANYISEQERNIMDDYPVLSKLQTDEFPDYKTMSWLRYASLSLTRGVHDSRLINTAIYVKKLTGIALTMDQISYFKFSQGVGPHIDIHRAVSICFPVDPFWVGIGRHTNHLVKLSLEQRTFGIVNTKQIHSAYPPGYPGSFKLVHKPTYFIGATIPFAKTSDIVKRIEDSKQVTLVQTLPCMN